jgi:integrase
MAKPLTVRAVECAKPRAVRYELSDGGCRGLRLVIQPSGVKSWAFRYRSPVDKRPVKLTLGPYPEFGLADARVKAVEALRAVNDARDPAAEKRQRKHAAADQSDLVETLLREFEQRYVDKNNRPRTAEEAKRIIRLHIEPAWKCRKIGEITKRDVIALLEKVAEKAPVASNRTFAVIRKFFNWLTERDVGHQSPTKELKKITPESPRERVISDDEIAALWSATAQGGPLATLVRILLLTGQRRNEVAGIRWSEIKDIDGPDPVWIIPAVRTKNGKEHAVPLTSSVIALIRSVPRIERADLILTTNGRTPVSGFSRFKAGLDAKMVAELKRIAKERGENPENATDQGWRLHDLRRTAASGMARLGEPVETVEKVLNHTSGTFAGIVGVYQRHDFAKEKRRALEKWAAEVERIVSVA